MIHLQVNICITTYSWGNIRIMACIKGTFASRYTHNGIVASRHTHKGAFAFIAYLPKRHLYYIPKRALAFIAYPSGHSHSSHTYKRAFAFMTYLCEHLHHDILTWTFTSWHTYMNICIMAYPQGGIYIMTYLHEHLHHDIHTRSICIMTCPLEGICTIRHFASPSL